MSLSLNPVPTVGVTDDTLDMAGPEYFVVLKGPSRLDVQIINSSASVQNNISSFVFTAYIPSTGIVFDRRVPITTTINATVAGNGPVGVPLIRWGKYDAWRSYPFQTCAQNVNVNINGTINSVPVRQTLPAFQKMYNHSLLESNSDCPAYRDIGSEYEPWTISGSNPLLDAAGANFERDSVRRGAYIPRIVSTNAGNSTPVAGLAPGPMCIGTANPFTTPPSGIISQTFTEYLMQSPLEWTSNTGKGMTGVVNLNFNITMDTSGLSRVLSHASNVLPEDLPRYNYNAAGTGPYGAGTPLALHAGAFSIPAVGAMVGHKVGAIDVTAPGINLVAQGIIEPYITVAGHVQQLIAPSGGAATSDVFTMSLEPAMRGVIATNGPFLGQPFATYNPLLLDTSQQVIWPHGGVTVAYSSMQIYMTYLTPQPDSNTVPQSITMDFTKIEYYPTNTGSAGGNSVAPGKYYNSAVSQSFMIQNIPETFYVWLQPNVSVQDHNTPDWFLALGSPLEDGNGFSNPGTGGNNANTTSVVSCTFDNLNAILGSSRVNDIFERVRKNGWAGTWDEFRGITNMAGWQSFLTSGTMPAPDGVPAGTVGTNWVGTSGPVLVLKTAIDLPLSAGRAPNQTGSYNFLYSGKYFNQSCNPQQFATSSGSWPQVITTSVQLPVQLVIVTVTKGTWSIESGTSTQQIGVLSADDVLRSKNMPQAPHGAIYDMEGGRLAHGSFEGPRKRRFFHIAHAVRPMKDMEAQESGSGLVEAHGARQSGPNMVGGGHKHRKPTLAEMIMRR